VFKKRVGFVVEGKLPVREGSEIFNIKGDKVGIVTSGGPAPSLQN
jgi:aminomethyltransferase